jgi:hypothetical protein
MEAVRESQETKRLIASAMEQQEQKKKKGFLARMFKKVNE